ncbi:MAG TPA: hypothetical protein VM734_14935 [Kofleriaceae bacterium]|jgi:hypothetical protein|nr:hypothetical protein [Kofleriaceae bacterium]
MPALAVHAHECDVCGAKVQELRRGRCWGCYARWVDARPVGVGARCVVCSERRRRMLRSVELHNAWHPMCFGCSGQAMALDPLPPTIAELKQALSRERRQVDRRVGKPDTRVFQYERRIGQRRASRDDCPAIDDDMIVEITIEDGELAATPVVPVAVVGAGGADAPELDFDDMTRIRELIVAP